MVYADDSKIENLKNQIQVIDSFIEMLDEEANYQKGTKQLNTKHKSYQHMMQSDVSVTLHQPNF